MLTIQFSHIYPHLIVKTTTLGLHSDIQVELVVPQTQLVTYGDSKAMELYTSCH